MSATSDQRRIFRFRDSTRTLDRRSRPIARRARARIINIPTYLFGSAEEIVARERRSRERERGRALSEGLSGPRISRERNHSRLPARSSPPLNPFHLSTNLRPTWHGFSARAQPGAADTRAIRSRGIRNFARFDSRATTASPRSERARDEEAV